MSKRRSVESSIRLDEDFAELTYRQRDLWHGLIVTADDQGRLPGHPGAIRSLVFPFETIGLDDISNDLKVLAAEKHEYILLYESAGKSYIQIINWWKYQPMQWAGQSTYPAPEGWFDRIRHHGKGRRIVTENWDTPGGFCIFVKDNDKDNDNDNVKPTTTKDCDKGSQTPYSILLNAFMDASKLPLYGNLTPRDNESLVRMVKAECTVDDIQEAVKYSRSRSLPIVGVASVEKGTMIQRSKRLSPALALEKPAAEF